MPQISAGDNGDNSDVAEGVFSDEEEEEEAEVEEVEEEIIDEAVGAGAEEEKGPRKKTAFPTVRTSIPFDHGC